MVSHLQYSIFLTFYLQFWWRISHGFLGSLKGHLKSSKQRFQLSLLLCSPRQDIKDDNIAGNADIAGSADIADCQIKKHAPHSLGTHSEG